MDSAAPESGGQPERPNRQRRWRERRSIWAIKKKIAELNPELTQKSDRRDNEETRLPNDEEINLGGIVLTEAFTPSTVSSLFRVLEQWPADFPGRRDEWVETLARSRGGRHGGWQNLGVVRPPGAFVAGGGITDGGLPPGVDAVWLSLTYPTPSLAMVVGTFTLTEGAGDLSDLLRKDYETRSFDPRIRVEGRFGGLRSRIPWARPLRYRAGASRSRAEDEKRKACDARIEELEAACRAWFFSKFPGRFAAAPPTERPVIRLLFTKEEAPYSERHPWLRPIGLDVAHPLWRSTENEGWWLTDNGWPYRSGRHIVTLAAKRADVAESQGGDETGDSNWSLTQHFGVDRSPLAERHAIEVLLAIYGDRLGELRDEAGAPRRLRRPVREGRILDNYLIRDGLDAATVAADLGAFTEDLELFRLSVPEFNEYRDHLPGPAHDREPLEYVPLLREAIRSRAARLSSDITITTENIKAAAELRQAIANTRLQRFILLLSVAAAVIAVVSLLVSH